MERVVNNTLQPITLEKGAVVPAAGTPEAQPKDVELTEKDRKRYVERGRLSIIEALDSQPAGGDAQSSQASTQTQTEPQSETTSGKRRTS